MDDRARRRDPDGAARGDRGGSRGRDDEAEILNVAVTGASGFIGRHLVRSLLDAGFDVTAVTRRPGTLGDLSNPRLRITASDLEHAAPSIHRESTVVHLAAVRAGAKESRARYLEVNRDAALRLADAALRAATPRFINVSTAMVFGPTEGSAADESASIPPFARTNAYIGSKIEALERLEALVPDGLPLVSLFPAIVYGPDHPSAPNRLTSHIRRLRSSRVRIHPADVTRLRTLAYVDDVVRGIRAAIDRPLQPGARFILGGEDISMEGFEKLVLALLGRTSPALRVPRFAAQTAVGIADTLLRKERGNGYLAQLSVLAREWRFDSTRAETILDYRRTPLHIGVEKTIQLLKTTRR